MSSGHYMDAINYSFTIRDTNEGVSIFLTGKRVSVWRKDLNFTLGVPVKLKFMLGSLIWTADWLKHQTASDVRWQ